jgi:hypothetical protein
MKILLAILAFILAAPAQSQILDLILFKQHAASSTAATPTFSPVAGTYSSTQTVTISSTTSLAVLCYTTDGTTPTETANLCSGGTTATYSTPITVSTTQTVKAIATLAGYTDSSVGSALYTISAGPAYVNSNAWPSAYSSGTYTQSLGWTVTVGNTLFVGVAEAPTFVATGASASGHTMTLCTGCSYNDGARGLNLIYYLDNAPSGVTAFTVTCTSCGTTNQSAFAAAEFSGLSTTASLRGTAVSGLLTYGNHSTWTASSGYVSYAGGELVIGVGQLAGNTLTAQAATSPWLSAGIYNSASANYRNINMMYQLNATVSNTYTMQGTATEAGSTYVVFLTAGFI